MTEESMLFKKYWAQFNCDTFGFKKYNQMVHL